MRRWRQLSPDKWTQWVLRAVLTCAAGCGTGEHKHAARPTPPPAPWAPLSRAAESQMIAVPSGDYIAGSADEEREQAYEDAARTNGDDRAREGRWFDREEPRHTAHFGWEEMLDRTPVTQAQYAEFLLATGRAAPSISEEDWRKQGYVQDYATQVARFNWVGGKPPAGREDHPVVLVTQDEAAEYCAWRGDLVGQERWLPAQEILEKAARGEDGRAYPWGGAWDPTRLNSADGGPGDTMPVGSFPSGAGPYGHLDVAGNVFEWTSSPWGRGKRKEWVVKGSAWDDRGGVGRGASRHGRPDGVRHVIVGFRCAGPRFTQWEVRGGGAPPADRRAERRGALSRRAAP